LVRGLCPFEIINYYFSYDAADLYRVDLIVWDDISRKLPRKCLLNFVANKAKSRNELLRRLKRLSQSLANRADPGHRRRRNKMPAPPRLWIKLTASACWRVSATAAGCASYEIDVGAVGDL